MDDTVHSHYGDEQQDRQPGELGQNVRRLRKARGWTLSETRARSGISVSTLSKVENGQLSLTFSNLEKLATGFGVDISELFDKPGKPTSILSATTRGSGPVHETDNYRHEYLCQDFSGRKMTPFATQVHARSLVEFGPFLKHPGQEFLYVLEGAIDLFVADEAPKRLRAGDSAYFDSGRGHAAISIGAGDAMTLSVIIKKG